MSTNRIDLVCHYCGAIFFSSTSYSTKYCSKECRRRAQQDPAYDPKQCPNCGKLTPRARKFCSKSCYWDFICHDPLKKICPCCHREFETKRHTQIYCSMACQTAIRRKDKLRAPIRCAGCGEVFIPQHPNQAKYCSMACYAANRLPGEQKPRSCAHCGDVFIPLSPAGRYCSPECRSSCPSLQNPLDYGDNWDEQREKALERDCYTCRICGDQREVLHVHHFTDLRGFEGDWQNGNLLDNLITLCRCCHMKVTMAAIKCPHPNSPHRHRRLVQLPLDLPQETPRGSTTHGQPASGASHHE